MSAVVNSTGNFVALTITPPDEVNFHANFQSITIKIIF
jgi:hypothetical protein